MLVLALTTLKATDLTTSLYPMTPRNTADAEQASVNGTTLHYEIAGAGQPLVLVHAGIADRRMWDAQFHAFAERFCVVRYDMRGFGDSPPVEGDFSPHEDLRELLRVLGIERAAFVGCSKGGTTVIDLALEHPEVVGALVAVVCAPGGYEYTGEPPAQWDDLVAAVRGGDLDRVAELEVEMWVVGPQRSPDQVDAALRERVRAMDRIALGNEALLGAEQPLEPAAIHRLAEIRAPTLVVIGALDDPDLVRAGELLAEGIAGARKATIHDAAHLPNMERPAEFNRLVLDFLQEHS